MGGGGALVVSPDCKCLYTVLIFVHSFDGVRHAGCVGVWSGGARSRATKATQRKAQRNASNASPEHHIRAAWRCAAALERKSAMQRKKHPCRRTPPAWVGRQDDGGNTRGGLLQAGQTHFTHTPTRGNTPLFAPAPSSDHGMRKLRGSVIRAAQTTGQTQQQRFSHSAAPCQGSTCFAHRRTLASLARSLRAIRPRPVSGASSSQPAVVERVCAAKRADGGQQQMLARTLAPSGEHMTAGAFAYAHTHGADTMMALLTVPETLYCTAQRTDSGKTHASSDCDGGD
ncbi:hypothetical protein Q7P35_012285 [Cladosporium inversicolor]